MSRKKPRLEAPVVKQVSAKTENQALYIDSIKSNIITICVGPAGAGKSHIAIGLAMNLLSKGTISNVVITRPVVESSAEGKGLGFLPGGLEDKLDPYLKPFYYEAKNFISHADLRTYLNNGKNSRGEKEINIEPLEYMRGRTFHNTFMILDEAQNATESQIRMFMSRMGEHSKMVVIGDPEQSDLHEEDDGTLDFIVDRLRPMKRVGVIELNDDDIVRSPIIGEILRRLA
jgi:phosphate starvation-inducible PhoH-like protein